MWQREAVTFSEEGSDNVKRRSTLLLKQNLQLSSK
jgi:hypothetical protein